MGHFASKGGNAFIPPEGQDAELTECRADSLAELVRDALAHGPLPTLCLLAMDQEVELLPLETLHPVHLL